MIQNRFRGLRGRRSGANKKKSHMELMVER